MNCLAIEKSPYLLQHADHPVDWLPWGDEAFRRARAEGKPIFLSVGYATCHWCHVMAHESFENRAIAHLLNTHFIPIKVDREERPDVDRLYMTFVQTTTGHGGWPMSVWLTPDLKPFYGGTYFPPEDRYGRPGFPNVLQHIADLWQSDRARILRHSDDIFRSLAEAANAPHGSAAELNSDVLELGYHSIAAQFESAYGGFSMAPKFPRPVTLHFLFRLATRTGVDTKWREAAQRMALFTLDKMAAGGLHDHLGGGFHRYSVDTFWHVPHFEKMLYDQAQLALACVDAFQLTQETRYAATVRDILNYVQRDMTSPAGGFYSAEDADSFIAHGQPEHAEGAFYVWSQAEIESALEPEEARVFSRHYGIESNGNSPAGSDPHGEFTGKNILIERATMEETARHFHLSPETLTTLLVTARAKLFQLQKQRPRPLLDDKILTAWNGLMISAFARAASVLSSSAYLRAAQNAAHFVLENLRDPAGDGLLRSYREGPSNIAGFADDYAFFIQGLLDLFEASGEVRWLRDAWRLQQKMDALFWDVRNGGYFSVSGTDPSILLRTKEDYDGAEPSANSIAAGNLVRLAHLLQQEPLRLGAERLFSAAAGALRGAPGTVPQLLAAYDFFLAPPLHIIIAGAADDARTQVLLREVHAHFLPHKILLQVAPGQSLKFFGAEVGFFEKLVRSRPDPSAFVCENFTCHRPVSTPTELHEILEKLTGRKS